jgi:endonuclease/exonuclease/phosphatase family metal-dependent hydrolase
VTPAAGRLSRAALALALYSCAAPAPGLAADFVTRESDLVTGHYAPPVLAASDSLLVVSYNIQYGEDLEEALADLRGEPFLARADIILLQEMGPEGCDRVARDLGCDFIYYPASIHPHHDRPFGNAVLTRGRITGQGFTRLPPGGPVSGTPRLAVFADLELGARRLRAVSIHSSTVIVPAEDRRRQVRAMLDNLAIGTDPLVIGGDFNTVSEQEALRLAQDMRRSGLREARLGPGPTIRMPWLRPPGINGRLDHVFCRGLRAGRSGIVAAATASDHYPVWTVLHWEDRAGP